MRAETEKRQPHLSLGVRRGMTPSNFSNSTIRLVNRSKYVKLEGTPVARWARPSRRPSKLERAALRQLKDIKKMIQRREKKGLVLGGLA